MRVRAVIEFELNQDICDFQEDTYAIPASTLMVELADLLENEHYGLANYESVNVISLDVEE
jgi:hypothetical protein